MPEGFYYDGLEFKVIFNNIDNISNSIFRINSSYINSNRDDFVNYNNEHVIVKSYVVDNNQSVNSNNEITYHVIFMRNDNYPDYSICLGSTSYKIMCYKM